MKFVLASYGTRGDVEPCAAVGLELLRREHDVRIAVPPNMLDFVESAGLAAVAYGSDSPALRDEDFVGKVSKIQDPMSTVREIVEYATKAWVEVGTTLTALADGADLLLAGMSEQGLVANVAEYHDIPLAALHLFPVQFLPLGWLHAQISKEAAEAQRRALGLAVATRRTLEPGPLEIQAYDEFFFPELAAEWARSDIRRPFVGALTLDLPTDADDDVLSWIAAGTPPIYFGFGSTPVASPADTVAMISAACLELGERALIYAGGNGLGQTPHFDHVKVVGAVNFTTIFPACRAVVHHGGAGTTAAGLRAGIPALVLWTQADQPIWAVQVERLNVGSARPFWATTRESLVADLRCILAPQYRSRARAIATRMTKPAEGVAKAADLVEDAARAGLFG
ncbi:glycosyltransferase [uncultured Mycobacterium sp.]|uniref:glycosyltransferase n=1 Tax=uncultured Mycobacterium sp. TaxID=171292 RepID=UPI0035CB28B3